MLRFGRKSDAVLVGEVLAGNRQAFGLLVERHLAAVQGVAYALTRSAADAEDLAQDAFLRAFENLGQLRQPERFAAWAVQIARNLAKDHVCRRGREAALEELPDQADEPLDPGVRELHALLRREVMGLGEAFREVIVLHYFSGLSTGEIGRVLGISRALAQKRLQRGRHELGQRLAALLGDALTAGRPGKARVTAIMAAVAGAALPARATTTPASGAVAVAGVTMLAKGILACAAALLALLSVLAGGWMLYPRVQAQPQAAEVSGSTLESQRIPQPVAEATALEDDPWEREPGRKDGPSTSASSAPSAPDEISGRVTDALGNPLRGASIQGFSKEYSYSGQAVSDREGFYHLAVPMALHDLHVWYQGNAVGTAERVRPGASNVDFVLPLAPAIAGRVTDVYGRPVVGAVVKGFALGGGNVLSETDEEGAYTLLHRPRARETFDVLEAPQYALHVSAPGYLREIRRSVTAGNLRADFQLERGSMLVGRVMRADLPVPVRDAKVSVAGVEATTDINGFFELATPSIAYIHPETEQLQVVARGYFQALVPIQDHLDAPPGKKPELHLEPAPVIAGVVVDAWGEPVPEATVALLAQEDVRSLPGHADYLCRNTITDESGLFEFPTLCFWPEAVRAGGEAGGTTVQIPAHYNAKRIDLRIELPRGARIKGRLRFDGKTPAEFAEERQTVRRSIRDLKVEVEQTTAQVAADPDWLRQTQLRWEADGGTMEQFRQRVFHETAIPDVSTGNFQFLNPIIPVYIESHYTGSQFSVENNVLLTISYQEDAQGGRMPHSYRNSRPLTLREGQRAFLDLDLRRVLVRVRLVGSVNPDLIGAAYKAVSGDNEERGFVSLSGDAEFELLVSENAEVELFFREKTASKFRTRFTRTFRAPPGGESLQEIVLPELESGD